MDRLFVAEKPSLAKAIAAGLGPGTRGNGFIRVGNDIVTWAVGHLLEQAPPKDYNPEWAKWRLEHLPYLVSDWKLKAISRTREQLLIIRDLLSEAKTVVNCGDPDREGQLLVDEVLLYYGWKGATQRLLLNATDPGSVKKALAKIEDNAKYRMLYEAALCRQRADWLVGMNLSVAATKTIANDELVSIGRVQTPTLGLVVRRDLEIENFVSKGFFNLEAEVAVGKHHLTLLHAPTDDTRIFDKAIAETLAKALTGTNQQLAVIKVMAKELAPLPFMLPTFQKAAEDELSLGAKATLDALQVLYEGQLVSYPRTDCEYLPAEQKSDAQRIANSLLTGADEFSAYAGFAARMIPKDRIYNSAKVAEHHGLVPTGKLPPADLAPKLRKAWALVAKRFLCSLMPDFEYEETEVSFVFQGRKFAAKGIIPQNLDQSWKSLIVEKDAATPSLPPLEDGQISRVDKVNTKAGKTTPPKAYTEATLIADMRSVAKYVDDPRYKAILKETSGIGTAATQAATLETLKDRGFISPSGKKLVSTPFGRDLIGCLPPMLYDPGVTGLWEDALGKIAKNEYPPEEFMRRINIYVAQRINEMKTASKKMTVKSPIKKKELKSTRSVNPRQPPSEHEKANFA